MPDQVVLNGPISQLLSNPSAEARQLNVAPGTVLYEPTDEPRAIYFVQRGQIRTYRLGGTDTGRLLEILGPGDWCGEAALARQEEYGDQAIAQVPSIVTAISVERLIELLPTHPELGAELLRQLSAKLSAARADAAGLVFEDCNERLLKTLVRFSQSAAAVPHPDGVVLRITHEQLAQAVGVARETVSLALTQLRLKNLLRTGRNRLTYDPLRLHLAGLKAGA